MRETNTREVPGALVETPEAEIGFFYESLPGRIVFAPDAVERLADEVTALGAGRRVLLITTGAIGDEVGRTIQELICDHIDAVRPHVPADDVDSAILRFERSGAEVLVCVGGGSAIGLAKAIALGEGAPIVAVPTTYSGSEMTPIYGITRGQEKQVGRDPSVLPKTVLYDPRLTVSLSGAVTATSGMNAMAHCVEALYAANASPVSSLMAAEGLRALTAGLPEAIAQPDRISGRSRCLLGAHLAGAALGSSSMGLHHRLCHVLGGMSRGGHGDLNAVVLPWVMAYNAPAAPRAMAQVEQAIGAPDAPGALYDFARRINAPKSLAKIGVDESILDPAAQDVAANPTANPRPYAAADVRALLGAMFQGRRPEPQDSA